MNEAESEMPGRQTAAMNRGGEELKIQPLSGE